MHSIYQNVPFTSDTCYSTFIEAERNVVILTQAYLAKTSILTRRTLAEYGSCPLCGTNISALLGCSCQPDQSSDFLYAVAICKADWEIVKISLEKDRLRIKASASHAARRHAIQRSSGVCSEDDLHEIRNIQKNTCYFCACSLNEVKVHLDHLIPISSGGSGWPSNVAYTCESCNVRKNSRTEREFWEILKKRGDSESVRLVRSMRASQRSQKVKIERTRKNHLKYQISVFEEAVNQALSPDLDIYVTICLSDEGLCFDTDGITLMTLPHTHRAVARMTLGACEWAACSASLHKLASKIN